MTYVGEVFAQGSVMVSQGGLVAAPLEAAAGLNAVSVPISVEFGAHVDAGVHAPGALRAAGGLVGLADDGARVVSTAPIDDVGRLAGKLDFPHPAPSAPSTTAFLPSKLFSYSDEATAALIERSQLGLPGRTTFLTPNGQLSPLQAQIELALPQKNTAGALFEISTEGLDASKIMLQRRVTGNVFNRGGGGVEILYDGPIPLENVRRIR